MRKIAIAVLVLAALSFCKHKEDDAFASRWKREAEAMRRQTGDRIKAAQKSVAPRQPVVRPHPAVDDPAFAAQVEAASLPLNVLPEYSRHPYIRPKIVIISNDDFRGSNFVYSWMNAHVQPDLRARSLQEIRTVVRVGQHEEPMESLVRTDDGHFAGRDELRRNFNVNIIDARRRISIHSFTLSDSRPRADEMDEVEATQYLVNQLMYQIEHLPKRR